VAMLTTVASDGSLRSRPMVTPDADFDGELWFFTRYNSPKSEARFCTPAEMLTATVKT